MIALGRRARGARATRSTLQTWTRWRADARAEGVRFAPAPEYHVFPTRERPLKPYEAVVRATGETRAAGARARAGRGGGRHPHAGAGAGRRARGRAGGDAHPPRRPARRAPGLPPLLARCAAAAHARWAGSCGAGSTARDGAAAGAGTPRAQRDPAAAGLAPLDRVHGGISPGAGARGDLPAARVPAARSRCPPRTSSDRCCGSRRPPTSSCRPATGRSCSSRPRPRRTRRTGCCARRSRGLATLPRARARDLEPPAAGRAGRRPGNARLVEWVTYARTMPRCDVVVCHGGHGTLARALASGCAVVVVPAGRPTYGEAALAADPAMGRRARPGQPEAGNPRP